MYKALMYIKERYGNPTVILSENGTSQLIFAQVLQGLCTWY